MYSTSSLRVLESTFTYTKQQRRRIHHKIILTTSVLSPSLKLCNNLRARRVASGSAYSQNPNAVKSIATNNNTTHFLLKMFNYVYIYLYYMNSGCCYTNSVFGLVLNSPWNIRFAGFYSKIPLFWCNWIVKVSKNICWITYHMSKSQIYSFLHMVQ